MTRATLYGLAAEFETDAELMHAAEQAYGAGLPPDGRLHSFSDRRIG